MRDAKHLYRADVVWQWLPINDFNHQEPCWQTADVDDPQILMVEGDLLDCNFLVAVVGALADVEVENSGPREAFDVNFAH